MYQAKSITALTTLYLLSSACVDTEVTCEELVTCPQPSPGGTSGAAGETGGMGGGTASGGISSTTSGGSGGTLTATNAGPTSSSGGGVGGVGGGGNAGQAGDGTGGSSGGSGGTGGSVVVPCDGACEGDTPRCNEETDTCVECLASEDCDDGVCDSEMHQCVECLVTEDCDAPTALCDPDQHFCVECLDNTDCTDPQSSFCDAGSCSPCQTNEDCMHLTGITVCDAEVGECVECTATDYASCGVNDDEEPLVCNSLTRTCSDQVEHDLGLCQSCVSDASCRPGHLCIMQIFNDQDVGYFCHWVEGDTEHGAPAECGPDSRPYVEQIVDAESIDGTVANVCGLRTSNCPARNEFSSKDCAPEGIPDDNLCGFDPPNDAKCVQFTASSYRCTMRCLSFDDCPGTECDTSIGEPVCEL